MRAYEAAYAWLQEPENTGAALDLLPARLAIAPRLAAAAMSQFAERPRPRLSPEGLAQVIDTVWEAEGYTQPKGSPGRYMDLSYMQRALAAAPAGLVK